MRIIFTTILALFTVHLFGQIINGSFDDWESANSPGQPYENPSGWITNNLLLSGGFADTPVIKVPTNEGFLAQITSNSTGLDATGWGDLLQKIALKDLQAITYESKCDSIYKLGACVVSITADTDNTVLYRDSVLEKDSQFVFNTIDIPSDWATQYDSVILKFRAYGYMSGLEPDEDAFSIFLIDNVKAEISSSTNELNSSTLLSIGPNPVNDYLYLNMENRSVGSRVQIYAMNGQVVYDEALTNEIEVGFLSAGVYTIVLTDGRERAIAKFVKE